MVNWMKVNIQNGDLISGRNGMVQMKRRIGNREMLRLFLLIVSLLFLNVIVLMILRQVDRVRFVSDELAPLRAVVFTIHDKSMAQGECGVREDLLSLRLALDGPDPELRADLLPRIIN